MKALVFILLLASVSMLYSVDWLDTGTGGKSWVSGKTSRSSLPREIANLSVMKTLPNIKLNAPVYKAKGMAIPESLDYRNWDGKNWMTRVKDTQACGGEHFALFGCIETAIKLFIKNDIVEPDMAEQYIVSYCYPYNG
jgi:hypothetical protein